MVKIIARDIESFAGIEFSNTGGAGYIDLCEVITDDVDPNKNEAFSPEHGPHLIADPSVSVGERTRHTTAAGGEVASRFTRRWDSCKAKGYRLAVDE